MNNRKSHKDSWPDGEMEQVKKCPVCQSVNRNQLYEGLSDNVFFCAPGVWNMYKCNHCKAAYLDPRPTPESIHLAYRSYYTHDIALRPTVETMSLRNRTRRAIANGYRNWRYGTQFSPSLTLGIYVAFLMPWRRAELDAAYRYIPRHAVGSRLLDVGFGSGDFLETAASAGWEVAGVDMDPAVVASAKLRGFNVRKGGIESWFDQPESFDAITISHVIEHVHNPVRVLELAFKLLKPGGHLWLETPNMESFGHLYFEEYWRGLEVPRHLVLFGSQSINYALRMAGFSRWKRVTRMSITQTMFMQSKKIMRGLNPNTQMDAKFSIASAMAEIAGRFFKTRGEFITLIAKK